MTVRESDKFLEGERERGEKGRQILLYAKTIKKRIKSSKRAAKQAI